MKHDHAETMGRNELAHAVKGTRKAKRTQTVLEVAREIVSSHGAKRFRGTLFDAFTASAIVQVYDALGDDNKAKYAAMDKGDLYSLTKMADVAFKCIK